MDEFESLSLARAYIDAVRENIGFLAEDLLISVIERLNNAYNEFPELELDRPRTTLLNGLQSRVDSSDSLTVLLRKIIKAEYLSPPLWLLRYLCDQLIRRHTIGLILTEFQQQGQHDMVVRLISELLYPTIFHNEEGFSELGEILKLLCDHHQPDIDGAMMARTVQSTQRRLGRPTTPPRNEPESRAWLLRMAERLRAIRPHPLPRAYPDVGWPSGRFSFDEFLLQWPCKIELTAQLDDAAFIEEAYRAILLRQPEAVEKEQLLALRKSSTIGKYWIIEELLASGEFRSLERRVLVICDGQVITQPGNSREADMPTVTWLSAPVRFMT